MKIVLYSGGLDSYIGLWLLRREDPSWLPVHFYLGIRYSWKELSHMPDVLRVRSRAIQGLLDLSTIERDDAYVPQRNAMLCTAAQAVYDASEIALCSVADDVYADNTAAFHTHMSRLLSLTARHDVRVFSPLVWPGGTGMLKTKAEAVAHYLRTGGDAEALKKTVSCYHPTELSCGQCKACTRHQEALEGIS